MLIVIPAALLALLLALPVALIGLPFWLLSAAVRGGARLFEPVAVQWRDIIRFDADVGWKPKANLDLHYHVRHDDIFRLVTDADGWPGLHSIESSDVVVFGDSYAFGFGAEPGSSFTDLNADLRVKAIAAPGYNMVQELLLMRELAPRLAGKVVIWLIYVENDLHDNVAPSMQGYRTPFVRRGAGHDGGSWDIVTQHLGPSPWTASTRSQPNLMILARLCTPCELSARVYEACRWLIAEGRDVTRAVGAQLVVMTAPNINQISPAGRKFLLGQLPAGSEVDPDYPDRTIAAMSAELGVPFVACKPVLQQDDYKRFERFHWNESGHRKAAALLRAAYAAHRTATSSSGGARPPSSMVVADPR